jgi:hypothetical protein
MSMETLDYPPAKVHIVADDTKPVAARRKFCGVISKSYKASATDPELILPRSAGRTCATIVVGGTVAANDPVILCDNQADAKSAALYFSSETGTLAGAVIPPGSMPIRITHNDEVWLARLTSALAAPLVAVIAEHEA